MSFNENHHPRHATGEFAIKPNSAPEATLSEQTAHVESMDTSTRRSPLPQNSFQAHAHGLIHWTLDEQRDLFDLNAPYQRGSVWTTAQRQNLIKSLLLGIPIGTIVYNLRDRENEDGQFIHGAIIDGKQRIEALRAFVDDEFAVPAWWFEESWLDHEKFADDDLITHSDLTVPGQRFMTRLPVPSLEARVNSVAEEAEIFDLINTAGTPQEQGDIARAREMSGSER